jgi:hypothetical protein
MNNRAGHPRRGRDVLPEATAMPGRPNDILGQKTAACGQPFAMEGRWRQVICERGHQRDR